jgi:imidazolonepropionase-like amidohydrolase
MKIDINNIFFVVVLVSFMGYVTQAQQVAKSEYGSFALTGATIHTITNGDRSGTVLISDGKITGVGESLVIPAETKSIDCSGLHIYPGMIDGGTTLGLEEVSSISLTRDADEIGEFTPHAQALTAVNPNATAIPVTRVNGITSVITQPTGGMFPGTASLIHLVGYTPDQMFGGFKAVVINFPTSSSSGRRDKRTEEERKKDEEKALKKLNEIWESATLHQSIVASGNTPEYNADLDALMPVMNGEIPVMIEVNKKDDILSTIRWVREKDIKAILTGCAEGFRVADSIALSGLPVITGPMMTFPPRSSDRYDKAYTNAGLMAAAGVKVAIRTNESDNVRNLPFEAGFAAAYGMGKEEALKAVTINPAEIFGLGDQLGSIEEGKIANIIVTDGDPLETKTQLKYLFINGWNVPLESRHTLLYDEFLNRSPGLEK